MNDEKAGVVSIHGLEYQTVALRVTNFRQQHPDWSIETKILDPGLHVIIKATIKDALGRVISTGHADEERGEGMINQTNALENCETSAVGRALAFFDQPGQFLRSADEMSDALIQQGIQSATDEFKQRGLILQNIIPQVAAVKDFLADNDLHAAAEFMLGFTDEQLYALRVAPTKGGLFTVEENKKMATDEFFAAKQAIGKTA